MTENDRYKANIKELYENLQRELEDCGLFEDDYIRDMRKRTEEKIMPLLEYKKPRIMVYGIYNSGKSTLVNAICEEKVAEVADRPMTDRITEYDAGKYILVDSPGVNAPMQHEEIADRHLEGCHMILFVVSSKGLFEDRVNYQKMGNLIQKELPFYIILNERAEALPPKEQREERREVERRHIEELNEIKRKIIKNLESYSGVADVKEKYDVIMLNAKRAWDGVEKKKENLIKNSRISDLLGRIDSILEGRGALKQLLAPLSAIEQMIGEIEKDIISEQGNEEYAVRREILQKKIINFREDFLADIRYIAERYVNDIYNMRMGNRSVGIGDIRNEICREVENSYKSKVSSLVRYMRENFPEISFKLNDVCNSETLTFQIEDEPPMWEERVEFPREAGEVPIPRQRETEQNGGDVLKSAGNIIGMRNIFPPIDPISIGLQILGGVFHLFKNKERAEQEERELRQAIEQENRKIRDRIEEDIRRRKEARTYANVKIDEMIKEIRTRLQDSMNQEFSRMIDMLDQVIAEKDQRNHAVEAFMDKCKKNRSRIAEIRKEIG